MPICNLEFESAILTTFKTMIPASSFVNQIINIGFIEDKKEEHNEESI